VFVAKIRQIMLIIFLYFFLAQCLQQNAFPAGGVLDPWNRKDFL